MTQLAYSKFCTLVATLSENLTTREVINSVRENHSELLIQITPHIQENAIVNVRRNVLRRRARLFVEGVGDLFEPYHLPTSLPKPGSAVGKRNSIRVAPEKLTRDELDALIAEAKSKPPRKDRHLSEMEKLRADLEGFCGASETVDVGLRRRRGH